MILPGFPKMMGFKDDPLKNYNAALAAITNKTIHLRADILTQGDGVAITTWDNEAGADFTATGSNFVVETNEQNGFRGVRNTSGGDLSSTLTLADAVGAGDFGFTVFLVYRAPGADQNILFDSNYVWVVDTNGARAPSLYINGSRLTSAGSYTDGQAFVVAFRRAAGSGSQSARMSLNGTVSTGSVSASGTTTGTMRGPNRTNGILFEALMSSDAVADAAMDDMVIGLKEKWGIA